ncbi:protein zwilch homolog isoform X2 [Esox lucius]|uniref:protein zwilch homolog isoform X2 n=1 Tax=Esox lucius TaxID=8010 RepID=UPI001476B0FD|nr:protein zwilch homolog isoform X2 [Esox lucius]
MGSKIIADALQFLKILRTLQDEGRDSCFYEDHIQILKVNGAKPLHYIYNGDRPVFICEKIAVLSGDEAPDVPDPDDEEMDESHSGDEMSQEARIEPGPQPLTLSKARQLLSWYTMSQNTAVPPAGSTPLLTPPAVNLAPLLPLWVRCDMADAAATAWLAAEPVCTGNKVSGVKLYSVTCKGSTVDKGTFITLDELKQEHKKRHHQSSVVSRGSAQYSLFGSTVVENTTIQSQSSVTADFRWNNVESILEAPPLSSMATLNIRVSSGDMRSPMFQMFKELEFLQILADGLRTGETEWMEPLDGRSAVDLTREYLDEVQNTVKSLQDQTAKETEKVKVDSAVEASIFTNLMERGDLDFVEQLWVRMRKSVTSYQDVRDCLKLVIQALQYGDIKPWIHRDSSSSLSKLILQSYHHQMDLVSLSGLTPVHMLLEMGLDKMRKDYINYLIGQELTTLNHLSYFLNTEVDLQEQVIRLRKLHHLLEIMVTCSSFLGLPYDRLFLLTQSCLQYYKTCSYDEDHEFKLPIKPALISHFYQKEPAVSWSVEVSSGHGPREVKTSWQLSDKPLVNHVVFETAFQNEMTLNVDSEEVTVNRHSEEVTVNRHSEEVTVNRDSEEVTVNRDSEEVAYFTTMTCCSLVNFSV